MDFNRLLESFCRLAAALKELEPAEAFAAGILNPEARAPRAAQRAGDEPAFALNVLLSYSEGLKRVFRSKYFAASREEISSGIEAFSSHGQLKSKIWLMNVLKERGLMSLGTVFLCAGWHGMLPCLLLNDRDFSIKRIFNFEKDPLSVKVSEDLNRDFVSNGWRFKAVLRDILDIGYSPARFETLKASGEIQQLAVEPDTVINTSCEHIRDFPLWLQKLPPQKLLILQSNSYAEHPDHINCSESLEDFKSQAPMDLIYAGSLDLKKYRRFMLIGRKPAS